MATVAFILARSTTPVAQSTIVALVVAVAAGAVVLVVAPRRAVAMVSEWYRKAVGGRQESLRVLVEQGQRELHLLQERVRRGDWPVAGAPPAETGDALQDAINQAQHAAQLAVLQASVPTAMSTPVAHVDVFVNLSRRLQSLVHRQIQQLDDLERQVEDPDLLDGLFRVDHLATRIRRHAENLAVLGGAVSRRQWTSPQALSEVLRSAIAEVEHFSRVQLVPPVEGTVHGYAVADVIHLVAELIENATNFSGSHTNVLLRVQAVTAGVVVEVEDRGLGMMPNDRQRVNDLLVEPQRVDLEELLRDGRLGLYVVASLARRHGIRVQLQINIFGGIQAIVLLPPGLLGTIPQAAQANLATSAQQDSAPLPQRQPVAALTGHPADSPSFGPPTGAARTVVPTYVVPPDVATTVPVSGSPHDAVPLVPTPDGNERRAGGSVRPPLPQRIRQTRLAADLPQPTTPPQGPGDGADPALMASFQRGFDQADLGAEQDSGTADTTDRLS